MASAIDTAERFFAILQKSRLLSDEEFQQARDELGRRSDVAQIARALVEQERITAWQARKLQAGQHALYLGKYKLLERLPWGDGGRVYLAEHTQMRARAALKTLDRRQAADPGAVERFQKEGAIAAALDHPNIIHVRDFDRENNYYFLVMEHVAGESLTRRVVRGGPLPPERAADYIAQAAAGLAHAHERGVTHGDLRPVNLLLADDGAVKILELGAARPPVSERDARPGSYDAPETLGDRAVVTARSDLYALGATFYYLLCGEAPPDALTLQKKHAGSDLRHRDQTPAELTRLCAAMMALDPAERPASAAEVAETLQAWLAQHAAPEETPETPEPVAAPARPERPVLKTRGAAAAPSPDDLQMEVSGGDEPAASPSGDNLNLDLEIPAASAAARVRGAGRPRSAAGARRGSGTPDGGAEKSAPPKDKRRAALFAALGGGGALLALIALGVWLAGGSDAPDEVAQAAARPAVVVEKKELRGDESSGPPSDAEELDFDFPQPGQALDEPRPQAAADAKADAAEAVKEPKAAADAKKTPEAPPPANKKPAAEPAPKEKPKPAADKGPQTPVKLHPVEIVNFGGPAGVKFQRLEDDPVSYLVTGANPDGAGYEIIASTDAQQITGVCIQFLAHKSLPKSGPGRADSGDFQLARARLYVGGGKVFVSSDELKLTRAEADFSAKDHPVAHAIDGDPATFWSVAPQAGKNHWAAFRGKPAAGSAGPTYLKLELDQLGKAAIGRFRLWAVTGTAAVPKDQFNGAPVNSPPVWNPFDQLAKAVTLPAADAETPAGPVPLGKLADDIEFSLDLAGGAVATVRQSFSLRADGPGHWNVLLHPTKDASGAGAPVAEIAHNGGQLALRWTAQAREERDAGYLANCVLTLDGGGGQHRIALRKPVEAPPLPLNMEGRESVKAPIAWLPSPEAVRVEFLPPAGFPPVAFEPGKEAGVKDSTLWMRLGKKDKLVHLQVTIDAAARGLDLEIVPHVALDPQMKPLPLRRNTVVKLKQGIAAQYQQLKVGIARITQIKKNAQGAAKKQLDAQKTTLETRLEQMETTIPAKLEALQTMLAGLANVSHIPYRVIYKLDGQDIELARSAAPPPKK